MNTNHLKKTLQLIRRTGDKAIIPDEASDEIFVLMGAEAYEKMLPVEKTLPTVESVDEFAGLVEPVEREVEQLAEEERSSPMVFENPVSRPSQQSVQPSNFDADRSSKVDDVTSEESLADVPHDGEEEEKFYLEPVG